MLRRPLWDKVKDMLYIIHSEHEEDEANLKADIGAANQVLDKIPDKKRGTGAILCLIDKKTYLRENLIALPIEYI